MFRGLIDDINARRGIGERMKTGNRLKRWEGAIWKELGRKEWMRRAGEVRQKKMSMELKENERKHREEMEGDRGDRGVI